MHTTSDLGAVPRPPKNNTSISDCPEAFARWYCLNGATCFSVKIHDSTLYNCWCPIGFHGLRCDYKYVASQRWQHQQVNGGNQQDSIKSPRAPEREPHLAIGFSKDFYLMILYNMLIVLLIFIIMVLTFRILKKGQFIIKTMGRSYGENPTRRQNNGSINQDCVTIEFNSASLKQVHQRADQLQLQQQQQQQQRRQ